ncbi:MAG: hypothetical protein ABL920_03860 [Methylotenera sp.]
MLALSWALRSRATKPPRLKVIWVALIVVVVGMVFAKLGANAGLSPAIYYGIPVITALALPPFVFNMKKWEMLKYVTLTFISSPIIHIIFSAIIGWHEYLPFWYVPSISELINTEI